MSADQAPLFAPARHVGCCVGIDPGIRGYVVALTSPEQDPPRGLVRAWPVPVIATPFVDEKGRERFDYDYDVGGMARLLFGLPAVDLLLIERQQPMPDDKRGAIGAWKSGHGWGLWCGLLAASGVAWQAIGPSAWKRALGVLPPSPPRRKKGDPKPPPEDAKLKAQRLAGRRRDGKALAVAKAKALFPAVSLKPKGARADSPDFAEALLLAHLARAMRAEPAR